MEEYDAFFLRNFGLEYYALLVECYRWSILILQKIEHWEFLDGVDCTCFGGLRLLCEL